MKREAAERLRWTPSAERDVEAAFRWLKTRNPRAARAFVTQVLIAIERLPVHPELGAVEPALEPAGRYRALVVGSYKVIYRLEQDLVLILRVWDARRDPEALELP